MNKIIIGVGIVAIIAAGWFLYNSNTVDYVVAVDDEVSQLEAELLEIDAAVSAGTLSPTEAAKAQTKIVARLETINSSLEASQNAELTEAQRIQLAGALGRLKTALTNYSATLVFVDKAVLTLPEDEQPLRKGGSSGKNSISAALTETVDIVEEQIAEFIEELADEAEALSDEEASTTDTEISVEGDAEVTASSSEDVVLPDDEVVPVDDEGVSSEETIVEEEVTVEGGTTN